MHLRVLDQHVGERLQFGARVGRAGRVRRRVEQHPFGLRRDRGFELRRRHLEAGRHRGLDRHRLAAGEQHHVGIAHPIRRRDHHLVARVERAHEGVVQHLLAAGADRDLLGAIVEAVLALELLDHGVLQLGDAVDVGVFRRPSAFDRLDRRLLDVVGRVEIRFAGAQPDDIAARRLERARLVGDGNGGRRFDALEGVRKKGHGESPQFRQWSNSRHRRPQVAILDGYINGIDGYRLQVALGVHAFVQDPDDADAARNLHIENCMACMFKAKIAAP